MLYALKDRDGDYFAYDEGDTFATEEDIILARKFSCPADAEAFIVSAGIEQHGWTLAPISAEGIAVAQDAMHEEFMVMAARGGER